MSPTAVASLMASDSEVVVLDIRTPAEVSEGVIEGAINIDYYEAGFATQLQLLDKNSHYCRVLPEWESFQSGDEHL